MHQRGPRSHYGYQFDYDSARPERTFSVLSLVDRCRPAGSGPEPLLGGCSWWAIDCVIMASCNRRQHAWPRALLPASSASHGARAASFAWTQLSKTR
jgi:hypothetical protein